MLFYEAVPTMVNSFIICDVFVAQMDTHGCSFALTVPTWSSLFTVVEFSMKDINKVL